MAPSRVIAMLQKNHCEEIKEHKKVMLHKNVKNCMYVSMYYIEYGDVRY